MTRREFPLALAVVCSTRLPAHQSDFWTAKDPSQWTAQEIDRLITNSPWAKEIKRPRFDAVVRWESAAPILDALKTPLPGAFENQYVIAMCGVSNLAASIDDVASITSIEVQGKPTVQANLGLIAPGTNTQTLLFGFQKNQLSISQDDSELVFRTQIGRVPVTARFNPREMTYRGALAL